MKWCGEGRWGEGEWGEGKGGGSEVRWGGGRGAKRRRKVERGERG